jgi:hypothetical protein
MRALCVSFWVAVLVSLVGCLPTLEPVYTESQLVFDEELVGIWEQPNSNNRWQVERGENKSYRVTYLENGNRTAQFVAHTCQLGDLLVLDLFPQLDESKTNGLIKFHQLPLHTAYVVTKSRQSGAPWRIGFRKAKGPIGRNRFDERHPEIRPGPSRQVHESHCTAIQGTELASGVATLLRPPCVALLRTGYELLNPATRSPNGVERNEFCSTMSCRHYAETQRFARMACRLLHSL